MFSDDVIQNYHHQPRVFNPSDCSFIRHGTCSSHAVPASPSRAKVLISSNGGYHLVAYMGEEMDGKNTHM